MQVINACYSKRVHGKERMKSPKEENLESDNDIIIEEDSWNDNVKYRK